jgi:hypothetical protein
MILISHLVDDKNLALAINKEVLGVIFERSLLHSHRSCGFCEISRQSPIPNGALQERSGVWDGLLPEMPLLVLSNGDETFLPVLRTLLIIRYIDVWPNRTII